MADTVIGHAVEVLIHAAGQPAPDVLVALLDSLVALALAADVPRRNVITALLERWKAGEECKVRYGV